MTPSDISGLSDDELDAMAATKVMGWPAAALNFQPSRDPAADYEVLAHIRQSPEWLAHGCAMLGRFQCEIEALWRPRGHAMDPFSFLLDCQYKPGDYARAALSVVLAEK